MAYFDIPVFPQLEPLNLLDWDSSLDQLIIASYSQVR